MTTVPDGFAWNYKGQIYRPIGSHEHAKRDGSVVVLLDWSTDCPECGNSFVASTPLVFEYPKRRCEGCKQPGKRVKYLQPDPTP